MQTLFSLGKVVLTLGASDLFEETEQQPSTYLRKHVMGDFGEMCQEDIAGNNFGITNGLRIMSCYTVGTEKLWVITEADRSVTTFLLPSEY